MMTSVTFYCWLCDKPLTEMDPTLGGTVEWCETLHDTHYETGRVIYFCCLDHWIEYGALKCL